MKPYFFPDRLILSHSSSDFLSMVFRISLHVDASTGQQGAQQANVTSRFGYATENHFCLF